MKPKLFGIFTALLGVASLSPLRAAAGEYVSCDASTFSFPVAGDSEEILRNSAFVNFQWHDSFDADVDTEAEEEAAMAKALVPPMPYLETETGETVRLILAATMFGESLCSDECPRVILKPEQPLEAGTLYHLRDTDIDEPMQFVTGDAIDETPPTVELVPVDGSRYLFDIVSDEPLLAVSFEMPIDVEDYASDVCTFLDARAGGLQVDLRDSKSSLSGETFSLKAYDLAGNETEATVEMPVYDEPGCGAAPRALASERCLLSRLISLF